MFAVKHRLLIYEGCICLPWIILWKRSTGTSPTLALSNFHTFTLSKFHTFTFFSLSNFHTLTFSHNPTFSRLFTPLDSLKVGALALAAFSFSRGERRRWWDGEMVHSAHLSRLYCGLPGLPIHINCLIEYSLKPVFKMLYPSIQTKKFMILVFFVTFISELFQTVVKAY